MKLSNQPKVLAATYNPVSKTKMISFLVDFPTVLLAELRTHRILTQGSLYEHSELVDFNLSANSARAIPHNKYLQKVIDNPFVPIWTKQQKGMSGGLLNITNIPRINENWLANLKDEDTFHAWVDDGGYLYDGYASDMEDEDYENTNIGSSSWSSSCDIPTLMSRYKDLIKLGVHKQNANRLLAPFAYTTCIISGTEWDNFFELRCPKYHTPVSGEGFYAKSKKELLSWHSNQDNIDKLQDPNFDWNSINYSSAQPEFQVIAEILYDLYQEADWKESKYHIPFEDEIKNLLEYDDFDAYHSTKEIIETRMLISASMCAKLSYNTQNNEDTLEKHIERANLLIEHKHQEPFSHQAVAMDRDEMQLFTKSYLTSNKPENYNGELVNVKGIVECYHDKFKVTEYGKCYNLTGFISQRYMIENL